jgi:hypothetical protein
MPGKRRPRPWCPLDREYLSQDTIRKLGERFGAAGPLVFLEIILEAGKTSTAGDVEMRFSSLGARTFVDARTVREIVCAAAEGGLIAELACDEERFSGRLTRFRRWEAKDPTSAQRSSDYRARQVVDT